jgi:biotin-[acetyl-CoA-carboxylase] ligase BirA-like protein
MDIYTDSVAYGMQLMPAASKWSTPATYRSSAIGEAAAHCYAGRPVHAAQGPADARWPCLLIVESTAGSQFDLLVSLGREGIALPDGALCAAGGGYGLHGLRGRSWAATPGNIHLSMWLAPPEGTVPSAVRFLAMAAVSVVETIDRIPGLEGRAGIRWVNDVFVGDAKVCGILTHALAPSDGIGAAVVGIGLNVETAPVVEPTPFVPRIDSLSELCGDQRACRLGSVFEALLAALARNYRRLEDGRYVDILTSYRARSLVIGRRVAVCAEGDVDPPRVLAEGRVERIGDDLELFLEGIARPFTRGRVLFRPE